MELLLEPTVKMEMCTFLFMYCIVTFDRSDDNSAQLAVVVKKSIKNEVKGRNDAEEAHNAWNLGA